ncbi:hypothetical protein ACLOJK_039173 [Asimina triloba]
MPICSIRKSSLLLPQNPSPSSMSTATEDGLAASGLPSARANSHGATSSPLVDDDPPRSSSRQPSSSLFHTQIQPPPDSKAPDSRPPLPVQNSSPPIPSGSHLSPSSQRLQQLQQASRPLAPATIAHERPPICSSYQQSGRRQHNPIPSRPSAASITAWPTSESKLDHPNNGTLVETQLTPITWANQQQIRRSNPTAPKIRHYPISKWPTPTSTQKLLSS